MSANSLFILVFVGIFIGSLILYAASIEFGLKWTQIADVSMLKALGLSIVFFVTGIFASALLIASLYVTSIDPSEPVWTISAYVLQFFVSALVVSWLYKVRWLKALKSIVPYALVTVLMFVGASVGIRQFVYEAFWIPTNSMAPTLLGVHWSAPCPRCGGPAYASPLEPPVAVPPFGMPMICSKERQTVFVENPPQETGDGDRILVCKLISPRRWDMIVFRYPADPTVNYVMRLVGLPGEKLEIREGAVWIDDEKMGPPASIAGIRYSPTIEAFGITHSGPGSEPVELRPDEYFVLGDFVDQSSDSRLWQLGAPGHPPYAVPESHIIGVVINLYWPINRWTGFR
jgi:signal peptidase I